MGIIVFHNIESPYSFPVIFDSGATLSIIPSEEDFVGPIAPFQIERRLGGMDRGMHISGIGPIKWSFREGNKLLVVHSMCYHVPNSKVQLIRSQRLLNKSKGVEGSFACLENYAVLPFNGICDLTIVYDSCSYLHIALSKNISTKGVQANLCVLRK